MYRWVLQRVDSDGREHFAYETFFTYTLTDEEADQFMADRREIARDLDHFHQLKKELEKKKDFESAKYIKKEVISDLDSMLKAYNIVKFILIDGIGKMPNFPVELLPKIRYLNNKYR